MTSFLRKLLRLPAGASALLLAALLAAFCLLLSGCDGFG